MILTKTAYEVTKREIERFEIALGTTVEVPTDLPIEIRRAQCYALQSVLDELREEAAQYERLHPEDPAHKSSCTCALGDSDRFGASPTCDVHGLGARCPTCDQALNSAGVCPACGRRP